MVASSGHRGDPGGNNDDDDTDNGKTSLSGPQSRPSDEEKESNNEQFHDSLDINDYPPPSSEKPSIGINSKKVLRDRLLCGGSVLSRMKRSQGQASQTDQTGGDDGTSGPSTGGDIDPLRKDEDESNDDKKTGDNSKGNEDENENNHDDTNEDGGDISKLGKGGAVADLSSTLTTETVFQPSNTVPPLRQANPPTKIDQYDPSKPRLPPSTQSPAITSPLIMPETQAPSVLIHYGASGQTTNQSPSTTHNQTGTHHPVQPDPQIVSQPILSVEEATETHLPNVIPNQFGPAILEQLQRNFPVKTIPFDEPSTAGISPAATSQPPVERVSQESGDIEMGIDDEGNSEKGNDEVEMGENSPDFIMGEDLPKFGLGEGDCNPNADGTSPGTGPDVFADTDEDDNMDDVETSTCGSGLAIKTGVGQASRRSAGSFHGTSFSNFRQSMSESAPLLYNPSSPHGYNSEPPPIEPGSTPLKGTFSTLRSGHRPAEPHVLSSVTGFRPPNILKYSEVANPLKEESEQRKARTLALLESSLPRETPPPLSSLTTNDVDRFHGNHKKVFQDTPQIPARQPTFNKTVALLNDAAAEASKAEAETQFTHITAPAENHDIVEQRRARREAQARENLQHTVSDDPNEHWGEEHWQLGDDEMLEKHEPESPPAEDCAAIDAIEKHNDDTAVAMLKHRKQQAEIADRDAEKKQQEGGKLRGEGKMKEEVTIAIGDATSDDSDLSSVNSVDSEARREVEINIIRNKRRDQKQDGN